MARLTKAQLLARIDAVERECAEAIAREEALRAELALYMQVERPSRREQPAVHRSETPAQWPIVTLGGVAHYKTWAIEGGRKVITYKPVRGETSGEVACRAALRGRTHIGRLGGM